MKTTIVIAAAAILACGVVGTATARSIQRSCVVENTENATLTVRAQALEMDGTITIGENEEIVFADLQFEDPLPMGTEIEIWPVLEGEVPAWEQGPEFPFKRNLWIVDERTGNIIRFDITQIARAWQSQELPDLGLLVRLPSDPNEAMSTAKFDGPKEVTLTYHLVNAPDAKKPPGQKQGESSEDTPRFERGTNN